MTTDSHNRGPEHAEKVDFDIFGGEDDTTVSATSSDISKAKSGGLDFDVTAEMPATAVDYEVDNTDMDADDATRLAAPGAVASPPPMAASPSAPNVAARATAPVVSSPPDADAGVSNSKLILIGVVVVIVLAALSWLLL
jgi:hypothetical protein